jgi:hypothetical protein
MTDQSPPDAVPRKTYADMVKSFKTMDIGQKTTGKTIVTLLLNMLWQL